MSTEFEKAAGISADQLADIDEEPSNQDNDPSAGSFFGLDMLPVLGLIVISSPLKKLLPGSIITICSRKPIVLGNDKDCDLPLRHESISEEHIMFTRHVEDWFIEELHSETGTLVDGEQLLGSLELKTGMRIAIGLFEFKVIVDYVTDNANYLLDPVPQRPGLLAIKRDGKILEQIKITDVIAHIRNMNLYENTVSYAAMFRAATDDNPVIRMKVQQQWPEVDAILYPQRGEDGNYRPEERIKQQKEAAAAAEAEAEAERKAKYSNVAPKSERQTPTAPEKKLKARSTVQLPAFMRNEKFQQRIAIATVPLVMLVAVVFVVNAMMHGRPRPNKPRVTHAYYYDLGSQELLAFEPNTKERIPGFIGESGKPVALAYVYACGDCTEESRWIGHLEMYDPEALKAKQVLWGQDEQQVDTIEKLEKGYLVVAPENADDPDAWVVRSSKEGRKIILDGQRKRTCPESRELVRCRP